MAEREEVRKKEFLEELEEANKRLDERINDLHSTLCIYEIACQEILDHQFSWRDEIVSKLPQLENSVIHVLTCKSAFALDHAVESLGALSQRVYDAFYEDFEPILKKATGIAC